MIPYKFTFPFAIFRALARRQRRKELANDSKLFTTKLRSSDMTTPIPHTHDNTNHPPVGECSDSIGLLPREWDECRPSDYVQTEVALLKRQRFELT